MKFVHTADWQIGMRADSIGNCGPRVREERFAAAKCVIDVAKSKNVDCILVAGDVFEDNAVDRSLVQKVADTLRSFSGPVLIIPGNHDPRFPARSGNIRHGTPQISKSFVKMSVSNSDRPSSTPAR